MNLLRSSPSLPEIRRAGPCDAEVLVSLVESAYRGEGSRRGWTTEADLVDGQRIDLPMMRDTLSDPRAVVLIAERSGEPLGCCEVRRASHGEASFGMFAVDPARQGAGIGAQLLAAAEAVAAESFGATHMSMAVIERRAELLAWYGRRGFHPTGGHRPFPYGDERFGRPRRDDLRFVVLAKDLAAARELPSPPAAQDPSGGTGSDR